MVRSKNDSAILNRAFVARLFCFVKPFPPSQYRPLPSSLLDYQLRVWDANWLQREHHFVQLERWPPVSWILFTGRLETDAPVSSLLTSWSIVSAATKLENNVTVDKHRFWWVFYARACAAANIKFHVVFIKIRFQELSNKFFTANCLSEKTLRTLLNKPCASLHRQGPRRRPWNDRDRLVVA